jgi:hypothetical protein
VEIGSGVTGIADGMFYGCTGLAEVIIPSSVKSIGTFAFSNCTGLTSIAIPDSVETISAGVFYECSGLTRVDIGDGVTTIGSSAFEGCHSLTSIEFGHSVTNIQYVSLPASVQEVTFKNAIQTFNANWLANDTNIKAIYIPRGSKASFETALNNTTTRDIAVACLIDTADYATKELVNEVVSGMHRQIAWDDPAIFSTDLSGRTISFDTTVNGYFGLTETGVSGTGKVFFESSGGYQLVMHFGPPDIFFGKKLSGDSWSDQILLWDYENGGSWAAPVLNLPADFGKITVMGDIDNDSTSNHYNAITAEEAITALKILAPNGIDELSHVNLTGNQVINGEKQFLKPITVSADQNQITRTVVSPAEVKLTNGVTVSTINTEKVYSGDSVGNLYELSHGSLKLISQNSDLSRHDSIEFSALNGITMTLDVYGNEGAPNVNKYSFPTELNSGGVIATQGWVNAVVQDYIEKNFATLMATYLESHAATFAEVDPDDEFEVEEPTEPAVTE